MGEMAPLMFRKIKGDYEGEEKIQSLFVALSSVVIILSFCLTCYLYSVVSNQPNYFLSICFARNLYTAATWSSSSSSSSSSSMSLPASLPFKCCVHSFGVGAVVISLSISDIRPSFHSL